VKFLLVGFVGGYNNVIHPYTHIAVVSLKNKRTTAIWLRTPRKR
jgi:hypothetical protein